MTFQEKRLRNSSIIVGIIIFVLVFAMVIWTSCPVRHLIILNDLETFEETLDPEFCEEIVYSINIFNDECEPYIEIVDCG